MIKILKHLGGGKSTYISFEEYLNEYFKAPPEGWAQIGDWMDRLFDLKTESQYKILGREIQVEEFELSKIKESYTWLKNEYGNFDDDILKFIAFLLGTKYFSKIGNPTFNQWLNAKDINHPFKEADNVGFSFVDALQYDNGQNAIRKRLLSTLHWISSQSGT